MEESQIDRLVKEIEFKSYIKRYNCECMTVLGSLFGGLRAEREIVKNGLNKKKE